ncbi:MAG: 4-(cytidine 5'-diphospho)-2-C-methyl-D-erythritol kinase [Fluviicola sp.]
MITFPTCKINLGLHILFKRTDGYHELETAMLELPISDVLEVLADENPRFFSSGLGIPAGENLCQTAEKILRNNYSFPKTSTYLHKNIPLGGGLAGGSSDAVFFLKLINEKIDLKNSTKKLLDYSAQLGSDCAFFVNGGMQICSGRGEITHPIQNYLKGYFIVLINLGIHVSTKEAFSNVKPLNERNSIASILEQPIKNWKDLLKNDFEESVFPLYPVLNELKDKLYKSGAVYASMSGSGSTMYGVFRKPTDLKLEIPENGFLKWVEIS